MKIITIILLLIHATCLSHAQSQDSNAYVYQIISSEMTDSLRTQIKFDKTKKQLVPKNFTNNIGKSKNHLLPKEPLPLEQVEKLFSALMYIIAALFILAIIYFIIQDVKKNKTNVLNKKLAAIDDFNVEDIEEVDFDPLLSEALSTGNYRKAVRIKFLRILQLLQLKNIIEWKPNKTNRKYVLEITDLDLKNSFRSIANIFDRLWYGNITINKEQYEYCNSLFDNFSSKLR